MSVQIGERLKEERTRLRLNQTQMAECGAVLLRSQVNYEQGKRSPDSKYLAGIAKAGTDVQHIITGTRAGGPEPLTQEEAAVLSNFRDLSDAGKAAVKATVDALSQAKGHQADAA